MDKCRLFLDIIRTVCIVLILFIIIGVLVFIYIEKDPIIGAVTSVVNNINEVGKASITLNKVMSNVGDWMDTNNILSLTATTIKDMQTLMEKNKDFDARLIINNLEILVALVTNISNAIP